ncbi:MAG: hypothetical protein ACI8XO_004192 [Verrucomicrobiales bacterium]|jgi:hypothetical protein
MTPLIRLSLIACAACLATSAYSQKRSIGGGNGFDSNDINVIPKTDPAKTVVKKIKTIQMVAVSPKRVWKSSDKKKGKPITGSLLAFEREAKTGKVSIIRDEKIKLLIGKKDYTLPLTKLSADDQAYIHNLVDSARIAGKLLEPTKKKAAVTKKVTEKNAGKKE